MQGLKEGGSQFAGLLQYIDASFDVYWDFGLSTSVYSVAVKDSSENSQNRSQARQ